MSMRKQFVIQRSLLMAMFVSLFIVGQAIAQNPVDKFRADFEKAVDTNNYEAQGKLVDGNKNLAFSAFFIFEKTWASAKVAKNEEFSEKQMNNMINLAASYRTKHKSKFLSTRRLRVETYGDEQLTAYLGAAKSAEDGYAVYQKGAADGNEVPMKGAIGHYTAAARAYLKIKDHFLATQNAAFVGDCWKRSGVHFNSAYWYRTAAAPAQAAGVTDMFPEINGALASMREKRQVEFPELINIKLSMADAQAAYNKALLARNTIDPSAGGGEESDGKKGRGQKRDFGPLKAPTTEDPFEFFTDKGFKEKSFALFSKIKVPYYNFGMVRPNNPDKAPFFQYVTLEKDKGLIDSSRFLPDSEIGYDGKVLYKGKNDKKAKAIKVKNKWTKIKQKIVYPDGTKRNITNMVMDWGAEDKSLFSASYRLIDAAKYKKLAWHGATGVSGKVRGHNVTILDCNGNGIFRDTGEDAVMIGKGKSARIEPLGRFIMLDGPGGRYPYEFKVNSRSGNQVRSRPFKGSLAPIIVDFKTASGARPDFLIIKGSGEDAEAYFDIVKAMDEPMWIPPGRYQIHLGYFTFGSGKKMSHILIKGGRSAPLIATSGQLSTWELGGSGEYGFRMRGKFEAGEKSGEVVVSGKDIEVFGNHGEVYFNLHAERIAPMAVVKKDSGTGKTLGKKQMKIMEKGEKLELWSPGNVTIKNCGSNSTKRFGQLSFKHGILGNIVSDWMRVE
ncbi:MAG: hypothetical protein ACI97A_000450 [Planctomycetota bacterium]|jgi:hypothetical protein